MTKCITLLIEDLETIHQSNRTPEEKDLLNKAVRGEVPWTKEIDELYMKALKDGEEQDN